MGQLDYYEERMADFHRRHPNLPLPTYYAKFANKYVKKLTLEVGPTLSPAGQIWQAKTRKALQVAIENKRAADPAAFDRLECDDKAFTKFAFGTHTEAYLSSGLDKLPLSDLIKIAEGPSLKDMLSPEGVRQVYQIGKGVAEGKARRDLHTLENALGTI